MQRIKKTVRVSFLQHPTTILERPAAGCASLIVFYREISMSCCFDKGARNSPVMKSH